MKTKLIAKIIKDQKKEIDYINKKISLNYTDIKGIYIIASVNVEDDIYEIESNVNLIEIQEKLIINNLIEIWLQHFSNSFSDSIITQEDREHALELIYK